jgi:anti-sigma factor RsiW
MNCEQAQRVISKSLDAEASADERIALDAHCADCDGCRAERERQLGLHASLTAAGADLLGALRPAVAVPGRAVHARRPVWRTLLRVASVAALMLLSGAAGYSLPRSGSGVAGRGVRSEQVPGGAGPAGRETDTDATGSDATGGHVAGDADRPAVMVAELESRPVREVVWDEDKGLRASTVVESGRVCRVADPNGEFALEWVTTDRHYQLVGFPQE